MFAADDYKKLTDEELISLYKRSSHLDIVGELYNRYVALTFGVCLKYLKNREESRDAVMQIFEKLMVSLKEHQIGQFKGWLYVTARNHCLMHLRSQKGKKFEELSHSVMEFSSEMHLEDDTGVEANLTRLQDCINQLGGAQQQCVKMFYLEKKCYREITEITGFDYKKVKSYIQNGKRNLKICLERNG